MSNTLKPVLSQPGVYRLSGAPETSPGSGIYVVSDAAESSPGSGIYLFSEGAAFDVTTSANPPMALLTFDAEDLPGSTHTITVTRSYDGITERVREGWNRFAAGGAVLTDSQIPTGVPVSYQAEAFDADGGSLGTTGSVTVQVDTDPKSVWLSDPDNANLAVQVRMDISFGATLKRVRPVSSYQIGDRSVALLGAKGKLQDLPLGVYTFTSTDAELLTNVLASTSILVRTMPPQRLPRLLYVTVSEVNEIPQDVQFGGELVYWDLTGQEISPSTLDILVPAVTWQSFIDAFPGATWDDVIAFYDGKSWFDVIKEFSAGSI